MEGRPEGQKDDQEGERGYVENICERGRSNNNLEGEKVHRHNPDNIIHSYTNGTATSNKQLKAEIFKATFVPQPPPADLSDIQPASYPTPVQPPPRIPRSRRNRETVP